MHVGSKHHFFEVQGKARKKERKKKGSAGPIVALKSVIQIIHLNKVAQGKTITYLD